MPPRLVTRTVRLRPSRTAVASSERLRLLTYPMALAQPEATVPLLARHGPAAPSGMTSHLAETMVDFRGGYARGGRGGGAPSRSPPAAHDGARATVENASEKGMQAGDADQEKIAFNPEHLPAPRRWVRDPDELCIASIHRSSNINRINSYVATYKFDDPQWQPLLLPEVHVLPKRPQGSPKKAGAADGASASSSSRPSSGAPPPSHTTAPERTGDYDVFIDYNKLTTLELVSRHANYALRHLVQKGHAMYLVNFAQHSIVQMRGLVETSYVTCAYGIKGERLRTHLVHIGPLDVRDVLEVDPATHRVSFKLKKPNVRRGVVALSMVEGYGTWFQRKPMLWQRTRRIGALQSQMGTYDYELCDPSEVGRLRPYEVSLLKPHLRLIGSRGGAEAVAIIASSQVAQNERLYLGQFEAPALTAVDAVQQLAHRTALHHQLLRSAVETAHEEEEPLRQHETSTDEAVSISSTAESTPSNAKAGESDKEKAFRRADTYENPRLQELRRLAGMERLLPVSWVTRTPPPYVPLESDLPFRIQISPPAVIRTDLDEKNPGFTAAAAAFPTGGSVGSPFVRGVPLSLYEYNVHQGVDHYIFDDAPSARPLKWWNQRSNMPYNGYLYGMRSGLLDSVEPAEDIPNPLARPSSADATTAPSVKAARQRRKRRAHARRRTTSSPVDATDRCEGVDGAAGNGTALHVHGATDPTMHPHADEKGDTAMALNLSAETLRAGAEELVGHDDGARQAALHADGAASIPGEDRPPLHVLVAPSTIAQRRLRRYARRGHATSMANGKSAPSHSSSSLGKDASARGSLVLPLADRAEMLLQRQLRLKRTRSGKTATEAPAPSSDSNSGTS